MSTSFNLRKSRWACQMRKKHCQLSSVSTSPKRQIFSVNVSSNYIDNLLRVISSENRNLDRGIGIKCPTRYQLNDGDVSVQVEDYICLFEKERKEQTVFIYLLIFFLN